MISRPKLRGGSALRRSVLSGISASTASLITVTAIQILSVPIFIANAGLRSYGHWLVLAAIPNFLSLVDLGFSASAATSATRMLVAHNNERASDQLRAACLPVLLVLSLITTGAAVILTLVVEPFGASFSGHSSNAILALLLVGTFFSIASGFSESFLRAAGHYPRGQTYVILLRAADFLTIVGALSLSKNLFIVAVASVCVRVLGFTIIYTRTRARLPWLTLRPKSSDLSTFRSLIAPSLGYSGFVLGNAAMIQGMTIACGSLLGPTAVVAYASVRTMVGTIPQVTAVIANGLLPTATTLMATGKARVATRMLSFATLVAFGLAILMAAVMVGFGPTILQVWLSNSVAVSRPLLAAFVISASLDVLWQIPVMQLRATNSHVQAGLAYIASAALALATALLTLPRFGLMAIPLALLWSDILVIPAARRGLSRQKAPTIQHLEIKT